MNWDAAIDQNRTALQHLLVVMFAAVGMTAGVSVAFVPRRVRLMVLRMLGPAESALRRLIMLEARDMDDVEFVPGPAPDRAIPRGKGGAKSLPFPLFDKRKNFNKDRRKRPVGPGPSITFFDGSSPSRRPAPEEVIPSPDDPVSAESLCRRLESFRNALGDLTKQARRLKRALARRKLSPRLRGQGPLRIHHPPGHRERGASVAERQVDNILWECHILARQWIASLDTS